MRVELGCPVEVMSIVREGDAWRMIAFNHAHGRVAAIEGILQGLSEPEGRRAACPVRFEPNRAGAGAAFECSFRCGMPLKPEGLQLLITRVRLEGNALDWKSAGGPFAEVDPLALLPPQEREALSRAAGVRAVCRARAYAGAWRCLCAELCAESQARCPECHTRREDALAARPEPAGAGETAAGEAPPRFGFLRRMPSLAMLRLNR